MTTTDKQIKKIKLHPDLSKVRIEWDNLVTSTEAEDEESKPLKNEYGVTGRYKPRKEFVDTMKKLRKFGHELCGMTVESKEIGDWTVSEVSFAGDVLLKQSRAVLKLSKETPTGKLIDFKCPQVTMYPEKDDESRYTGAEKMSVILEDLIEEAWLYLNGEYADEGQLPLFQTEPKLQTNFDQ